MPWRLARAMAAAATPPAVMDLPVDEAGAGEAVEIGTGAPVPYGTEAVVPYEAVTWADGRLRGPFEPGRHNRRRGEDCRAGTRAVPAGSVVTSIVQGLAASVGQDLLRVRRRPRVAVLVTGDELTSSGLPGRGPGTGRAGADAARPDRLGRGRAAPPVRVADRRALLATAIAGAAEADVVVVCGSSSKGAADHLRAVLREGKAEFLVEGVACRPGHPQLLARLARVVPVGRDRPGPLWGAALAIVPPGWRGEAVEVLALPPR